MTDDKLRAEFEALIKDVRGNDDIVMIPPGMVPLMHKCYHDAHASGYRAGLEKAKRIAEKRKEERFEWYGTYEPDTGAGYYTGKKEDIYDALDEEDEDLAAAIQKEIEK